jgi:hypothetical protein
MATLCQTYEPTALTLQIQLIDFAIQVKAGRETVVPNALSRVVHDFALDHVK